MVLSDNGASQEGGALGVLNDISFFVGFPENIDDIVATRLDDTGGPHSSCNYPWGWAQAGNTPLRWYKQNTYGGGVRDPLVVRWPGGIDDPGAIRTQFCHVIDLAPTILELTGAPTPEHYHGIPKMPLHGKSIASTFTDGAVPAPRSRQYFEQFGHRGLWDDGWKITTYHQAGQPFDDDEWGLFHVNEDFSECHDLAAENPERLREMIDAWWVEAGEHGILPLDDRLIELFLLPSRPGTPHARDDYVYYPPMSHLPMDAAPRLGMSSWDITADVTIPPGGAEGVIYARGTHNTGHSFFLAADGGLHFDYNALGDHHRAHAQLALAPGRHTLTAHFDATAPSGTLTIGADGHDLASVEVPKIMLILGWTGVDIGRDSLSPVVDDYPAPFPFTGDINSVTFTLHPTADGNDIAAIAGSELAKE